MSKDGVKIRGFFRVQLQEEDRIVGDSDWVENQVTNDGILEYLVSTLGAIAGSKQVSHVALGTGTVPGAAATTLANEITENASMRKSVTAASNGSTRVDFTATFNSDLRTDPYTIQNIGLFQQSNTNTATLFAGNTYATSQWATNQAVNVTYSITFS